MSDFDYLDECAERVKSGELDAILGLSTGETIYVALDSGIAGKTEDKVDLTAASGLLGASVSQFSIFK